MSLGSHGIAVGYVFKGAIGERYHQSVHCEGCCQALLRVVLLILGIEIGLHYVLAAV